MNESRVDDLQEWDWEDNCTIMFHPEDETLEVWDGCQRVHRPVPKEREQYVSGWAAGYSEGVA